MSALLGLLRQNPSWHSSDLGLSRHTPLSVLQGHASLRDNMRLQRLVQQLSLLVTSGSSLPAAGHAAFGGGDLDTDAGAEVLSGLHSQVLQMGDAIFLELAQQVTALLCCSACLCQASGMGLCCMACLPTANRNQGCRFERPAWHRSRHKSRLTWPVPYVLLTSHSSTGMPLAALQSLRVDRALALQQLWANLRLYMAKLAHLDEADAENSIAVATPSIPVEQQVPGALSKPVCGLLSKCVWRCSTLADASTETRHSCTHQLRAQITLPKLPGTRECTAIPL